MHRVEKCKVLGRLFGAEKLSIEILIQCGTNRQYSSALCYGNGTKHHCRTISYIPFMRTVDEFVKNRNGA